MTPKKPEDLMGTVLSGSLTPSGRIIVRQSNSDSGRQLSFKIADSILNAFSDGRGAGVLHLGVAHLSSNLPPSLAYWRNLSRLFISRVCGVIDEINPSTLRIPPPDTRELTFILQSIASIEGARYLSLKLLEDIWIEMGDSLFALTRGRRDAVRDYLLRYSPYWETIGFVCFHLVENSDNYQYPFTFISTCIDSLSREIKPMHMPLGITLKNYAKAENRQRMMALMAPISRAAKNCKFIRELADCGDIFHPLLLSSREAHKFLCELPSYGEAGIIVRVPDWWKTIKKTILKVKISVGGKVQSTVGIEELLKFNVKITLGGEELSEEDIENLHHISESLVRIKGKWVELDQDKLDQLLKHFDKYGKDYGDISFAETMQEFAGLRISIDENDVLSQFPIDSEIIMEKWLSKIFDSLIRPELLERIEGNAGLLTELRPYQKVGVQWLSILRSLPLGACLADDMGLGKTIQVLAILNMILKERQKGTDLLIVPASLVENWHSEIRRFAPKLKVLIAHPSRIPSEKLQLLPNRLISKYDAVITTYGMSWRTAWIGKYHWRNLIIDEAQYIKNPNTRQTRAVKAINAHWRLALTGTPVENRLGDLWSIFDFINPGLLGSANNFNRLCGSMARALNDGEKDAYKPLQKLIRPYILQRKKTDKKIITDLPDKNEINTYCLLSKRQAVLYESSVAELNFAINNVPLDKRGIIVLQFLMRFKQICNHPSQWLGDGSFKASDSGKFSRLKEICKSIAAVEEKVLIFTQFRQMIDPIASFLADIFGRNGLVLHGATAVKKRPELVRSFQEDASIPFMVISLRAGGTGLNLTAASHVIHFDRWWNPAVENQATDRAYRIGQKKNVLVHKFICSGTLEERIDDLINEKQALSDRILNKGVESSFMKMSNDEIISIVSLNIKEAMKK